MLGFLSIYIKNKLLTRKISVSPIKGSSTRIYKISDLSYYYEPVPNENIINNQDWLSGTTVNKFNSDGLAEEKEYSLVKKSNSYRIVALGDSFTMGLYVDTRDNWTELLETQLNTTCNRKDNYEVINLGNGGYDIRYGVERYKTKGRKYNPDMLIWFLKDDDFDIINEYVLPLEITVANEMGLDRTSKTSKDYFVKNGVPYPSWRKSIEMFNKDFSKRDILNYQNKALSLINKYFDKYLVIFTFPKTNIIYTKILQEYSESSDNIFFYKEIPYIYDKRNEKILPDGHPDAEGYKIIAQDLFIYLIEKKLIPCH